MEHQTIDLRQRQEPSTRTYSKRGDSSFAKFYSSNGQVYGTLTLDKRHAPLADGKYHAVVRVAYAKRHCYLFIGKDYTEEEWLALCECEKLGRNKKSAERTELKERLAKVECMVNRLMESETFSLTNLQSIFQNKPDNSQRTVYSIWEQYIADKSAEGKAGSARCSRDIFRRFCKDMGESVSFNEIGRDFIQRWVKVQKKNGLCTTSIAIALRTFRTIVNICISQGLVSGNTKEMFKDTGYNKSQSRKHEFLDVPTMRMLYDFWKKDEAKAENGNELFMPREKRALFRDLGLFLFMYLGDGQNLADTLRLTYDGWYYATNGKQLRFLRHKTRERNESASEVVFPVTPELKEIIARYGNEPKMGRRVFPIMSELNAPEQEIWVIQRYNRYIREHMAKVAELLGMEQRPSPTWARHSFATNLNNSGVVPYKYISDSMGHSDNGDITSNYIGAYPLEKMLKYNHYLLHEESPEKSGEITDNKALIEMLKGLSDEEKEAIVSALTK
ncbi:MAG: site-specific integrase [Prevotella sp.]|nr:site-specific integrase [Prevotella sp.]